MRHIDLRISTAFERYGEHHGAAFWTFGAAYAIVWFLLEAVAFLFVMPLRMWFMFMLAAVGVYLLTLVVQVIVQRPRPPHHRTQPYTLWIHTYSFPSAHTSASFGCAMLGAAAATMFAPTVMPWLLVANVIVAAYVGMSRVFVGVHFLGDVIVGSAFGVATGLLFANVLLG